MTNIPMTLQDWGIIFSLVSVVTGLITGLITLGMKGINKKIDDVSSQNVVIITEVNIVKQRQAADMVRFANLEKYINDVDVLKLKVSRLEGTHETCQKTAN